MKVDVPTITSGEEDHLTGEVYEVWLDRPNTLAEHSRPVWRFDRRRFIALTGGMLTSSCDFLCRTCLVGALLPKVLSSEEKFFPMGVGPSLPVVYGHGHDDVQWSLKPERHMSPLSSYVARKWALGFVRKAAGP